MSDLKITDKSLAAALLAYKKTWNRVGSTMYDALSAFVGALTVPVQEPEGWVEVAHGTGKTREFRNKSYMLTAWATPPHWFLYLKGDKGEVKAFWRNDKISRESVAEAQAWADGIIREREAGCTCGPYAPCPTHEFKLPDSVWTKTPLSEPKPFGPGSEAIMPNGDRVRVAVDPRDGQLLMFNLTKSELLRLQKKTYWVNVNSLRTALEEAGAKIL